MLTLMARRNQPHGYERSTPHYRSPPANPTTGVTNAPTIAAIRSITSGSFHLGGSLQPPSISRAAANRTVSATPSPMAWLIDLGGCGHRVPPSCGVGARSAGGTAAAATIAATPTMPKKPLTLDEGDGGRQGKCNRAPGRWCCVRCSCLTCAAGVSGETRGFAWMPAASRRDNADGVIIAPIPAATFYFCRRRPSGAMRGRISPRCDGSGHGRARLDVDGAAAMRSVSISGAGFPV